jgi:hypothetical protein
MRFAGLTAAWRVADEYWQRAHRLVEEESAGGDSADATQDAA